MNVFGKRERSWRKAHKRGVSPIIATILLVAITVVLAAVLYVLISGLTKGPGSTPIGSAFGFGTAVQTTSTVACATGHVCYSVGIASASSSVTTATVSFSVQASGVGTAFTSVALVGLTGSVLACFVGSSSSWVGPNTGATACGTAALTSPVSISSTQTLVLDGGTSSLAGDALIAAGTGSLQGTTSVTLP